MSNINFSSLISESRGQVYLVWAALTGIGYTATHYYQNPNINILWFVLSVIGFGFMYKVMPLGVKQMKNIYTSWVVPVIIGLGFSVIAARTDLLPELLGYLGAFWLLVQAVAFLWNGLVDSPGLWYFIAAGVNIVAAAACYLVDSLVVYQYLIAAIVTVWSMLMLWVYRTDA